MILHESELCFGKLAYENRTVAFFDILGWKEEIDTAGNDPRHIARLATAVRLFASHVGTANAEGVLMTTFSDNVVVSKPFAPNDVWWLLQGLATTQLGLASLGFWMRGGVTVGGLFHDDKIVFGPALNRAYYLESKVAKFPRIIVDECLKDFLPNESDYLANDDDQSFVDAYRPEFWDRIQTEHPIQQKTLETFQAMAGITLPQTEVLVPGTVALGHIASRLSAILTTTAKPDVWAKLAWLFDRIMPRIGSGVTAATLPQSAELQMALSTTD